MGKKELDQLIAYISGRYSAGKDTTAHDLVTRFGWKLKQAQNKLEYLKVKGRIVTPYQNSNPQKYYPLRALEKITKHGDNDEVELHRFQKFLMDEGKGAPLLVHNIQLLTAVNARSYHNYPERKADEVNESKRFHANINGNHVWAYLYPNGTIQIFACLSFKPFKLEHERDIDLILIALGEWRRGLIDDGLPFDLADPQDWTMTHADFNKDIKRRRKPDFTIDMHQTVERVTYAFRIYTKFIENQLVYRMELSKDFKNKPNVWNGLRWGLNEANEKLKQEVSNLHVQIEESEGKTPSGSASVQVDDKYDDSAVREKP